MFVLAKNHFLNFSRRRKAVDSYTLAPVWEKERNSCCDIVVFSVACGFSQGEKQRRSRVKLFERVDRRSYPHGERKEIRIAVSPATYSSNKIVHLEVVSRKGEL